MRLVIVESPTKARTIERFLGDGYRVVASMGHVRDLPANAKQAGPEAKHLTFGIDVKNKYQPHYVISPQNQSKVRALKQALKGADEVFIATDEDREGEAIGWHVLEVLKPTVPVRRMAFHEITESAIARALEETREIDTHLVEAQETRRVLDRLVGYAISPLLWRKISQGLSAGRVQSVAVKLLVDRERERLDFVPAQYWDVEATASHQGEAFRATLTHVGGIRLVSGKDFDDHTGQLKTNLQPGRDVMLLAQAAAEAIAEAARAGELQVGAVEHREEKRSPAAPFTTSTLQQEASRKLGWSARDTMRVAQGLYERGLITYMRTDSTNLAPEALDAIRETVAQRYGSDHLPDRARAYPSKSKNAQEAHEAIRPAGTEMRTGDELGLRDRDAALYDLIWKRAVASQMVDARLQFTSAFLDVDTPSGRARFRATGRTTLFAGFYRAYVEGSDDPDEALEERDQTLPALRQGERVPTTAVNAVPHETKPPARYTEASLVKRLESAGIGRPSTYAAIIDTIQQRRYVRKQGSQLIPTCTGFATTQLLETQFSDLVDETFTALMEDRLDDIARGKEHAQRYLDSIWASGTGIEARVNDGLASLDAKAVSTIAHPNWSPFTVSVGRYGPYVEGVVDGEPTRASLPDDTVVADLTRDMLERALRDRNRPAEALGHHEPSGLPMFLKRGPYGHYLQLGDGTGEERPKRVSLPPGVEPDMVDAGMAQALLDLPHALGVHPETGETIEAHIGRFGPYVRHQRLFASLPKGMGVLDVDLATALELLARKRGRNAPLRELGAHPEDNEPITLHDGKYGPYVKHGDLNASLPEGASVEALTVEQAVALLKARAEASDRPVRAGRRGRVAGRNTKREAGKPAASKGKKTRAAPKKKGAAAKAKPAVAQPKATPEQLLPFLSTLEGLERDAVAHLDGLGRPSSSEADAATALGCSVDDVRAAAKRGRFKLRMAFGRARKQEGGGGQAGA